MYGTRRALSSLRKKYAAIIRLCRHLNFGAGVVLLLAAPCAADNLDLPAPGGHATIDFGGVYESINITGSAAPSVDITSRVTLLGPGGNQPIITGSNSAFLRVVDTTLSLGSATAAYGGLLRGDIALRGGTLQVYGVAPSLPQVIYVLSGQGETSGAISGDGTLRMRSGSILESGPIGSADAPLPELIMDAGSRLQMRDGIHIDTASLTSASLSALDGDIYAENLTLAGGSEVHANRGDIHIGDLTASSPDDEFAYSLIAADQGSVSISGHLELLQGLTSIVADKDITIDNGQGSISGPGELHLRANGNLDVGSITMADSDIRALRVNIGEDMVAKNALAAQLIARTVTVGENLEIQGNSVNIFGTKVDYGILKITEDGSRVGGNLSVFDAKLEVPDLTVGGDAYLSAVSGTFNNLAVGRTFDFAAGDLTGASLAAADISVGASDYATTLKTDSATFSSLTIGRGGTFETGHIDAPGASIHLSEGGALNLASGDLGSQSAPVGDIFVGRESALQTPASIYAASLGGNGASTVQATANIAISGDIAGDMHVHAGGDIEAQAISVRSLTAKNAAVLAGTLNLTETGNISSDLLIYGPGERGRAATGSSTGSFDSLAVGDTLTLGGSGLSGRALAASTILAGSSSQPTSLAVDTIAPGFGLGAGANAMISLGRNDLAWLREITQANSRSASAAVGVYSPVKVGETGVRLDPAVARPAPQHGQLEFAPDSLLVIYGPNARESVTPQGMISATTPMQAHVSEGAKLLIDGVAANQVYGVLGDNITTTYAGPDAWSEDRIETGSHLIGIGKIEGRNGWFGTYAKGPSTSYPGLDPGLHPVLPPASVPATPVTPAIPTTPPSTPDTPVTPPSTPVTPPSTTPSTPVTPPSTPGTTPSVPVTPPSTPGTTPSVPVTPPSTPGTPPSTPSTPTVPDNPGTTPSVPVTPPSTPGTTPSVPVTPPSTPGTTPSVPVTPPSTPVTPPSTPVTPPTTPDNPGTTPSTPSNPGTTPSTPSNPGTTPSNPSTPTTPDNPGATPPATPDTPDTPDTPPAAPDTPAEPDTPATPPAEPDKPTDSDTAAGPDVAEPPIGTDDRYFNSDYAGVRFLSRVTSVKYMDHDYDTAWRTIESAARMAVLGAVPQLAYAANLGAAEAAGQRASFADSFQSQDLELNGRAFALWITPLYRNLQGYGLNAYNLGYDLSGGLGGVALGADYTFANRLRAGIDINMGGGYAKSGGDLSRTTNDMGFAGLGAYLGWLGDNFGISADFHYTSTWNSLKQEFPARLEMRDPTGDLTAQALSAGLRLDYHIPAGDWQLIPHAGARYANVHVDNYSIYSGGAMIDGQAFDQNIWTFPFGLELRGDFTTDGGWQFIPALDALVTPASGDMYANTKLQFTGVPGEANIDTQTMDYWMYGGSVGLTASKDSFSLGLRYQIQAGMHTTAQTIMGTLVYEF